MNLREAKGYAYGAGGGIRYTRATGTFQAGASVRTDVTKESILELYREVANMAAGQVGDAELQREKNGSILALPGQFSTGAQVLGSFRGLVYFGLPLDYYATYVQNVSAVTREAVEEAARRHLKPAEVQVLVVGDGKAVLPGLRELVESKALGEGELVVLDVDGNPVESLQSAK
jgi:zinc protease